jgi:hypothetical protein
MPYALCPMPYALCPMPYALCPMPYAQSYLIFLRNAISVGSLYMEMEEDLATVQGRSITSVALRDHRLCIS